MEGIWKVREKTCFIRNRLAIVETVETVDNLKTETTKSKAGFLHTQKTNNGQRPVFSQVFLEDCVRQYGGLDIVNQTLEVYNESRRKIANPMAWFRQACSNNEYRRNVERVEANWQREKEDFAAFAAAGKNPLGTLMAKALHREPEKEALTLELLVELQKMMSAADMVHLLLRRGYDREQIVAELKRLAESNG